MYNSSSFIMFEIFPVFHYIVTYNIIIIIMMYARYALNPRREIDWVVDGPHVSQPSQIT